MSRGDEQASDAWHELGELAAATQPALRTRVAEAWTRAAQFEHASIASFDRFALQLLALGAPPALLEDAHRAALDEIEHARLSFRVASIYAGRPLGPGPLPIAAAMFSDFSLETVLRTTVEEGCVGETLAAARAETLREHVRGSALRTVFDVVCRDEAKHAALAFQLARWSLEVFGSSARDTIERSFEDALARLRSVTPAGASEPELFVHGQASELDRHVMDLRALSQVIEPARAELLAHG